MGTDGACWGGMMAANASMGDVPAALAIDCSVTRRVEWPKPLRNLLYQGRGGLVASAKP